MYICEYCFVPRFMSKYKLQNRLLSLKTILFLQVLRSLFIEHVQLAYYV